MKNILVPIGISPNGKSTLAYAVELAKHFKASLFVIDSYNAASIPAQISSAKEVFNKNAFYKFISNYGPLHVVRQVSFGC